MAETLNLTLPFPPSVNTYWRSVVINGRVRVLISQKGREYRKAVAVAVAGTKWKGGSRRLAVEVSAHMPDKRKRDLDNLLKATLDALSSAGIYEDDSQIDILYIERISQRESNHRGGLLDVNIEVLD